MSLEDLKKLLSDAPLEVVTDVEHLPDVRPGLAHLLGVALCWPGSRGYYVPVNHWVGVPSTQLEPILESSSLVWLRSFLAERTLMGWNIEHDREWVDACFEIESKWSTDGRILWYLTDREQKERGYGLKKAQTTLLGWPSAGDRDLREEVSRAGGSVDRGEHYLASRGTLERYASLDAYSTLCVIDHCKPRLAADGLLHTHDVNRDYAAFLARATRRGVEVDVEQLNRARLHYENEVTVASQRISQVCAEPIRRLEAAFLTEHLQGYKTERGKSAFMAAPSRHPRFNPNSSQQRSRLFHEVLGIPVRSKTETGLPKSDKNTIASFNHPASDAFVELSENEKLLQFSEQYLKATTNGTIHFPHDTCATVSERLGGYAPYDLNMPFASEDIMRAFRVRDGMVGIHMDLVSIEPCLIAGFSGDETMLKVYRDGLGDIYLDLCLDLFPLEEASLYGESIDSLIRRFHGEYNSNVPPKSDQKESFGRLRKIVKIIHLAVGYTGTKFTVAKNLTQAGFPTSEAKAALMVGRYWLRFAKVAALAYKLKSLAKARGYINGLYGRRLYIPSHQTKDALNRFGQFGGHAILRDIVFRIAEASQGFMFPLLPDIHDSTSWEVPENRYDEGVRIFNAAIEATNRSLALSVNVRGEIKQFHTFFGLKNKED